MWQIIQWTRRLDRKSCELISFDLNVFISKELWSCNDKVGTDLLPRITARSQQRRSRGMEWSRSWQDKEEWPCSHGEVEASGDSLLSPKLIVRWLQGPWCVVYETNKCTLVFQWERHEVDKSKKHTYTMVRWKIKDMSSLHVLIVWVHVLALMLSCNFNDLPIKSIKRGTITGIFGPEAVFV